MRPERRRHSRRQFREGQGRHGAERQERRQEGHGKNEGNQTEPSDRQVMGVRRPITEHEPPGELKLGPRTDPLTDSRSKVQDTSKHMPNPTRQGIPKVHPRLIKSRKPTTHLPSDARHSEHQEKEQNIPDNLTLEVDINVSGESGMTNSQTQKRNNKSGIHEETETPTKTTTNGENRNIESITITPASEVNHKKTKERPSNYRLKSVSGRAVRVCVLLPNGTVAWREPDTSMCREEAMQVAEKAAQEVVSLTNSPAAVDSSTFILAADQLAELVEHAVKDRVVSGLLIIIYFFYLSFG